MPRAITSATLSVGLLAIPVKLYTSAASEQARFNMLHGKCGGKVKQQYFCPVDDEIVERADMVKGFEHAKGQFVTFTNEELKSLESERSNTVELVSFVPASTFDFVSSVEKTYLLGPDKGADRAYTLISLAMEKEGKVAVGQWAARGKEQLVIIRPHNGGLVMLQCYYSNEVRSFTDIMDGVAKFSFKDNEVAMATNLIEQMSEDAFDPSAFSDEYAQRVMEAVQQKLAGEEITIAPTSTKAKVTDLFAALQASADAAKAKKSKSKPSSKPVTKPTSKAKKKKAG